GNDPIHGGDQFCRRNYRRVFGRNRILQYSALVSTESESIEPGGGDSNCRHGDRCEWSSNNTDHDGCSARHGIVSLPLGSLSLRTAGSACGCGPPRCSQYNPVGATGGSSSGGATWNSGRNSES